MNDPSSFSKPTRPTFGQKPASDAELEAIGNQTAVNGLKTDWCGSDWCSSRDACGRSSFDPHL